MEKNVDQAWRERQKQRVEWINERVQLTPILGDYINFQIGQHLSDYKQALRDRLKTQLTLVSKNSITYAVISETIQLLDHVTPTKE